MMAPNKRRANTRGRTQPIQPNLAPIHSAATDVDDVQSACGSKSKRTDTPARGTAPAPNDSGDIASTRRASPTTTPTSNSGFAGQSDFPSAFPELKDLRIREQIIAEFQKLTDLREPSPPRPPPSIGSSEFRFVAQDCVSQDFANGPALINSNMDVVESSFSPSTHLDAGPRYHEVPSRAGGVLNFRQALAESNRALEDSLSDQLATQTPQSPLDPTQQLFRDQLLAMGAEHMKGPASTNLAQSYDPTVPPRNDSMHQSSNSKGIIGDDDIDAAPMSELDPKGEIRAWIREVLTFDLDGVINPLDVMWAYNSFYYNCNVTGYLPTMHHMVALMHGVFPAIANMNNVNNVIYGISGIRWGATRPGTESWFMPFMSMKQYLTMQFRKMRPLPPHARVRMILKMTMTRLKHVTISVESLWEFYRTACRYGLGSDYLVVTQMEFMVLVDKVFGRPERMEVSPDHWHFIGLGPRAELADVDRMIDNYYKLMLKRYVNRGFIEREDFEKPKTAFAAALAKDPVFVQPAGAPVPWASNLRRIQKRTVTMIEKHGWCPCPKDAPHRISCPMNESDDTKEAEKSKAVDILKKVDHLKNVSNVSGISALNTPLDERFIRMSAYFNSSDPEHNHVQTAEKLKDLYETAMAAATPGASPETVEAMRVKLCTVLQSNANDDMRDAVLQVKQAFDQKHAKQNKQSKSGAAASLAARCKGNLEKMKADGTFLKAVEQAAKQQEERARAAKSLTSAAAAELGMSREHGPRGAGRKGKKQKSMQKQTDEVPNVSPMEALD